MSEDLKTIKELAGELGINKLRIYRFIDKRKIPESKIINTTKHYDLEAQQIIMAHFDKADNDKADNDKADNDKADNDKADNDKADNDKADNDKADNDKADNDKVLREKESRINFLEKEIDIKNSQISQIQNLLDQQQRLALQDKKLLEEYKAENDSLKALKIPSKNTKEEQSSNQSLEKEREFVQTIQESYESEIKVLNQKLAEQEEQLQEIQKEKETKDKKWFQFWK